MRGDHLALDQRGDQVLVDPVDAAGELLVNALQDADRHRANRIGDDRLERALGQALEDEVGNPGGRPGRQVERGGVGHAGAVAVRDRDAAQDGELLELVADAVDEDDLDPEAAEDGDVDKQVPEILVGDYRAVDRDDEDLPLEARHVLENPPEVGGLDRGRLGGRRRGGCDLTISVAHFWNAFLGHADPHVKGPLARGLLSARAGSTTLRSAPRRGSRGRFPA